MEFPLAPSNFLTLDLNILPNNPQSLVFFELKWNVSRLYKTGSIIAFVLSLEVQKLLISLLLIFL